MRVYRFYYFWKKIFETLCLPISVKISKFLKKNIHNLLVLRLRVCHYCLSSLKLQHSFEPFELESTTKLIYSKQTCWDTQLKTFKSATAKSFKKLDLNVCSVGKVFCEKNSCNVLMNYMNSQRKLILIRFQRNRIEKTQNISKKFEKLCRNYTKI